jgi:DNA-binding transcriptional ArsR family regulator
MSDHPSLRLRAVHRALADPLRIQLLELVTARPRSARELAVLTGRQPNRLYHHLARLEEGGLIEVTEYRRVPGGKVERVYAPAAAEPPGDTASPAERAQFLSAVLEATRADITAASQAQETGERRSITVTRSVIQVSEQRLADLNALVEEGIRGAQDHPDDGGAWATVLWVAVDRQDRQPASSYDGEPGRQQQKKLKRRQLMTQDQGFSAGAAAVSVCLEEAPAEDQAALRAGDALTASEAEQPRPDDRGTGFLVHLPAQGLLPALAGLGAARGHIPDHAVPADHDDVAFGGHADTRGAMRGTARGRRRWMPRYNPLLAAGPDRDRDPVRRHRSVRHSVHTNGAAASVGPAADVTAAADPAPPGSRFAPGPPAQATSGGASQRLGSGRSSRGIDRARAWSDRMGPSRAGRLLPGSVGHAVGHAATGARSRVSNCSPTRTASRLYGVSERMKCVMPRS